MPHYYIECRLAERSKFICRERTRDWHTAFHGTNMSCLYAIVDRGCLDTGPNGKNSTRRGKRKHHGVFCHKTRFQSESCALPEIFPIHWIYRSSIARAEGYWRSCLWGPMVLRSYKSLDRSRLDSRRSDQIRGAEYLFYRCVTMAGWL